MARIWASGFELNSFADEGITTHGSNNSIVSSTVRTGNYSYQCNPSGSASYVTYQFYTSNTSATVFTRVYIYIASLPSSTDKIFWIDDTQTLGIVGMRLTTTGALQLYNESANTQVGSNSSPLSTNTWHCLEMSYNGSTVSGYVDQVQFATGSASAGSIALFGFGDRTGVTANYFFDDAGLNDNSGLVQNGLLLAGGLTLLSPVGAGDNNGFTTQVGGTAGSANNYTRVNSIPPNDSAYNGDTVANHLDEFVITSVPSSIGANDTINVVMIGLRFAAASTSGNATLKARVKSQSGGTVTLGNAILPGSTSFHTNGVVIPPGNYTLLSYTDPQAGGSWTKALLNTTQIGYEISLAGTNASYVSGVWAYVDSTPIDQINLNNSFVNQLYIYNPN